MSKPKSEEVMILSGARTPFGAFLGALSSQSAPQLGSTAIRGALGKAGVPADQVSEVIMGNVLPAGVGQAPARQASKGAGIPDSVPCMTLNKVCGSGMKSIMLASQSIRLGENGVVVAGGMESMSRAPHLLMGARGGFKMGDQKMVDSMVHDGLWDPYHDQHMGHCAELCAREYSFSREAQDAYAIESFQRAQAAQKEGKFNGEVVPVEIAGRKGEATRVECDEGPGKVKI